MGTILIAIIAAIAILSAPSANAVEKSIEFACATKAVDGAFFAPAGFMKCDGGPGADKMEVTQKGETVFCMYRADCAAITRDVRNVILKTYNARATKKVNDVGEIADDELNITIMDAAKVGAFKEKVELTEHWVQCVGTKESGKTKCPGVNDCINNRDASAIISGVRGYSIDKLKPIEKSFKLIGNTEQ